MEDDIFYASSDRSSIEVIEADFALSAARAKVRRSMDERLLKVENLIPAGAIVVVIVTLLGMITSIWPVI